MLEATERVYILVTSRERLNVRGEQVFVVEGLPYAHGDFAVDALAVSAVHLFAQSARRAHSSFQLNEQNLADVLRICQLVRACRSGSSWLRHGSS